MKFIKYLKEKQDEPSFEDEFDYVSSTIRKMAKSQGFGQISIYLDEEQLVIIEITLKQRESFETVYKLLDFISKIQKDILVGFKCDMDLWENKKGSPIFTFEFYQSSVGPTYDYNFEDDFPY